MKHQTVLVLDFGGQYNQLIARRVRECEVYCEVEKYNISLDRIKEIDPIGIIFTGGPNSIYEKNSPNISKEIFELNIPILGICYGAQLIAYLLGGEVSTSEVCEYGKTQIKYKDSILFDINLKSDTAWMSHTDYISKIPEGFMITGCTDICPVASMENKTKSIFALQFHPEVLHTNFGIDMIKNFLYKVCRSVGDWTMKDYSTSAISNIKSKVLDKKVLLGLSGGVDSSVAAALLSKSIGKNLTCIFVDHGFMRKDEGLEIAEAFKDWDINLIFVDAKDRFLSKLAGISEPESKRKIIGEEFVRVFEDEALKIGEVDFLAQGTIYPDVVESGIGDAAVIKSHHNVGGLPENLKFKDIIEPLRLLFKDEVRKLGLELGLSKLLVNRQPFPGPGLAIRIIGDITEEKLEILKDADYIFREEIAKHNLDGKIDQYFAVLTNIKSVGVMGDSRTYDYTLALRGVTTTDFMTADFARIPYEVLELISTRIVNEVKGINRIVYDITTKPPSTIEWE